MAPRMRHGWLVGLMAGCGALVAWLVPPEPWTTGFLAPPWQITTSDAETSARTLRKQVTEANEILKLHRLGEYVAQRMEASIGTGSALVIELAPEYAPSTLRTGLASIREQFEDIGGGSSELAFGLLMVDNTFGNHTELRQFREINLGHHIFVDMEAKVPYCAVVVPYNSGSLRSHVRRNIRDGRTADRPVEARDPFKQCGWFIRYGAPGPALETWLRDAGAYSFAGQLFRRYGAPGPAVETWLRDAGAYSFAGQLFRDEEGLPPAYTRAALGRVSSGSTLEGLACATGRVAACRALLAMEPREELSDRVAPQQGFQRWNVRTWAYTYHTYRYGIRSTFPFNPMLFPKLEDQFGTEAFRNFWRSKRPVQGAFEEAFGVAPGVWMESWTRGHSGELRAGPAISFENLGLSLLSIFSMLAIAIQVARKRTA